MNKRAAAETLPASSSRNDSDDEFVGGGDWQPIGYPTEEDLIRKSQSSKFRLDEYTSSMKSKTKKMKMSAEAEDDANLMAGSENNRAGEDSGAPKTLLPAKPAKKVESRESKVLNNVYFQKAGTKNFPGMEVVDEEFSNGILAPGYVSRAKDGIYSARMYKTELGNGIVKYKSAQEAAQNFNAEKFRTRNRYRRVSVYGQNCYEIQVPMAPVITNEDSHLWCTVIVNEHMLGKVRENLWSMQIASPTSPPYVASTHEMIDGCVPVNCPRRRFSTKFALVRAANGADYFSWRDMRVDLDPTSQAKYIERALKDKRQANSNCADSKTTADGMDEDYSSAYDQKVLEEKLARQKKRSEEKLKRKENAKKKLRREESSAEQNASTTTATPTAAPTTPTAVANDQEFHRKQLQKLSRQIGNQLNSAIATLSSAVSLQLSTTRAAVEDLAEKVKELDDKIECAFEEIEKREKKRKRAKLKNVGE